MVPKIPYFSHDFFQIAVEALSAIKTVASLHAEDIFNAKYREALHKQYRKAKWQSHVRGASLGISQSVAFFAYSAVMYYGSVLMTKELITYGDLFK